MAITKNTANQLCDLFTVVVGKLVRDAREDRLRPDNLDFYQLGAKHALEVVRETVHSCVDHTRAEPAQPDSLAARIAAMVDKAGPEYREMLLSMLNVLDKQEKPT